MNFLEFLDGFKVYQHDGKKLVPLEEYNKMKARAEGFRDIINEQSKKLNNGNNSIENI